MYLQMKTIQCENKLFHGEIILVNNVDFPHNSQKKPSAKLQIFFLAVIEGKSRKTGSYQETYTEAVASRNTVVVL